MTDDLKQKLDALCGATRVALTCKCTVRDGEVAMPLDECAALVKSVEALRDLLRMRGGTLSDPYGAEDGSVIALVTMPAPKAHRDAKGNTHALRSHSAIHRSLVADGQPGGVGEMPELQRDQCTLEGVVEDVAEPHKSPAAPVPQGRLQRLMARGPAEVVLDDKRIPWAADVPKETGDAAQPNRPTYVVLVADPEATMHVMRCGKRGLLKVPAGVDLATLPVGARAIAEGGGQVGVGVVDPPAPDQAGLPFTPPSEPD